LLGSCLAAGGEPAERPWFERVERDRDRGAGRILDEPTWELDRLRDDRPPGRREFRRISDERDRRLQLDARERQARRGLLESGRLDESVILSRPPSAGDAVMSPVAAQAAADERALADAKDRLDRSVRAVNAAEQRSLRSLQRRLNREGRAADFDALSRPVRERHERLRAGHRQDYQRVRSRVLGRP
jgi:hypothetical protein